MFLDVFGLVLAVSGGIGRGFWAGAVGRSVFAALCVLAVSLAARRGYIAPLLESEIRGHSVKHNHTAYEIYLFCFAFLVQKRLAIS